MAILGAVSLDAGRAFGLPAILGLGGRSFNGEEFLRKLKLELDRLIPELPQFLADLGVPKEVRGKVAALAEELTSGHVQPQLRERVTSLVEQVVASLKKSEPSPEQAAALAALLTSVLAAVQNVRASFALPQSQTAIAPVQAAGAAAAPQAPANQAQASVPLPFANLERQVRDLLAQISTPRPEPVGAPRQIVPLVDPTRPAPALAVLPLPARPENPAPVALLPTAPRIEILPPAFAPELADAGRPAPVSPPPVVTASAAVERLAQLLSQLNGEISIRPAPVAAPQTAVITAPVIAPQLVATPEAQALPVSATASAVIEPQVLAVPQAAIVETPAPRPIQPNPILTEVGVVVAAPAAPATPAVPLLAPAASLPAARVVPVAPSIEPAAIVAAAPAQQTPVVAAVVATPREIAPSPVAPLIGSPAQPVAQPVLAVRPNEIAAEPVAARPIAPEPVVRAEAPIVAPRVEAPVVVKPAVAIPLRPASTEFAPVARFVPEIEIPTAREFKAAVTARVEDAIEIEPREAGRDIRVERGFVFRPSDAILAGADAARAGAAEASREARDTLVRQIAGPVADAVAHGLTRVVVRLQPEHLGTVVVSLVLDQARVSATISVANRQLQEQLQNGLAHLQGVLANQGVRVEGVQVLVRSENNATNAQGHNPFADLNLAGQAGGQAAFGSPAPREASVPVVTAPAVAAVEPERVPVLAQRDRGTIVDMVL